MAQVNFDISPFKELESPLEDFGEPVIEEKGWFSDISAYIADAPLALSLAKLNEHLEKPEPSVLKLYERYNLWLIPNRVSILKHGKITEPVSVGIIVEYRNDNPEVNLNPGMTSSIISLLPTPQYISLGGISGELGGVIEGFGNLNINSDKIDPLQLLVNDGRLKIGINNKLETHLRFKFDVTVPIVSAIGVGSSRAEWLLGETSQPLYGQDIETWTFLALPKRKKQLTYRIKLYLTLRAAYISTRRESSWTTLTCSLSEDK